MLVRTMRTNRIIAGIITTVPVMVIELQRYQPFLGFGPVYKY